MFFVAFFCALLSCSALAQDPGPNWIVYAKTECPAGKQLTKMTAQWIIPENGKDMKDLGEFWTPWFGVETSDNMNLMQPVTCWGPNKWTLSTEYYQWNPDKNVNSDFVKVYTGDSCWGEVSMLPAPTNATEPPRYKISMGANTNGTFASTGQIASVQFDEVLNRYKNYTIGYVVFEHPFDHCDKYSGADEMTFFNISVECGGVRLDEPQWSKGYVQRVCDFDVHIVSPSTVKFTWDHNK